MSRLGQTPKNTALNCPEFLKTEGHSLKGFDALMWLDFPEIYWG